jgi:L-cystine uptake protein TcyP (sodium:dicarboxylate symporter family)
MNPQTINLIHTIIKIIGVALVTHGATKAAAIVNSEDCIGVVVTIVGLVLSWYNNRTSAIIQKAADAIPDGTVIAATTPQAPKAQVMTPESATDFIRKPSTTNTANP